VVFSTEKFLTATPLPVVLVTQVTSTEEGFVTVPHESAAHDRVVAAGQSRLCGFIALTRSDD
jgi:hypothetical protein